MIQIGIVGLGFMASAHIKAYRQIPQARIAAICNPSGKRLDGDLSDVFGNVGSKDPVKLDMSHVRAFRNYREMLACPDLQLIDICSPTPSHPELAIAALDAGKHVIVEKPLARTSELGRQIAAAAERSGRFAMPAMCLRFWPEWAWVKRAIDSGECGRVLAARFRRVAEPPAWGQSNFFDGKRSGGALLDLHIHDTDFVQFCFGHPTSVFSSGYTKFTGAIDHVVTQYTTGSGAIVHAEGSWAMAPGFGFNMSYTVNFERATVDYDLARGADALRFCVEGKPAETITCPGPDGYVGELQHIIDAITSNTPPSVVTLGDGVSAIEICEAEEESIRRGQPVQLG